MDDNVRVVLAVSHELVHSFDSVSEVLGAQQACYVLDVFILVRYTLCLRSVAVITVGHSGKDTQYMG